MLLLSKTKAAIWGSHARICAILSLFSLVLFLPLFLSLSHLFLSLLSLSLSVPNLSSSPFICTSHLRISLPKNYGLNHTDTLIPSRVLWRIISALSPNQSTAKSPPFPRAERDTLCFRPNHRAPYWNPKKGRNKVLRKSSYKLKLIYNISLISDSDSLFAIWRNILHRKYSFRLLKSISCHDISVLSLSVKDTITTHSFRKFLEQKLICL